VNTRTGLDKATLKIALQDCKISQNVSVEITRFFFCFLGNYCRNRRHLRRTASLLSLNKHGFRTQIAQYEISARSPIFQHAMAPQKSPSFFHHYFYIFLAPCNKTEIIFSVI
jgi:hypothetical protein